MEKKRYIILEIIPTTPNPETGDIAQLSALKLNGLSLEDRFDYRLQESKIKNDSILEMINYDKKDFKYVSSSNKIMKKFIEFIEDYDLLIIDNLYTRRYLEKINNKKESIFSYLHLPFSDDVIDKVVEKYQLERTNYIVDLLYEALIFESNHRS